MALPIYSSKNNKVAYGGVDLDGLAPDSFITFSFTTDRTDEEVGADGQTMISIMPDQGGTCTVSLQQASPANLILAGVLNFNEVNNTLVRANLAISDPSGSVLAFLRNAHIKTAPEVSLGSTATGVTRDWVFYCEQLLFTQSPDGLAISDDTIRIASAVDTIITNV
jgi:hypothetical protein